MKLDRCDRGSSTAVGFYRDWELDMVPTLLGSDQDPFLGFNPEYSMGEQEFIAMEQGGVRRQKIPKRKHEGRGRILAGPIAGFLLKTSQSGRTSPGGR